MTGTLLVYIIFGQSIEPTRYIRSLSCPIGYIRLWNISVLVTQDDFTALKSVGSKKEERLREAGFETYRDIVESSVSDVREALDIGYSKAIPLASEAVELLDIKCPDCPNNSLDKQVGEPVIDNSGPADVVCHNCGWTGQISEAQEEQDLSFSISDIPSNSN